MLPRCFGEILCAITVSGNKKTQKNRQQKKTLKKRPGGPCYVNGRYQIVDTTNGPSLDAKQNGGLCTADAKI